MTRNEMMAYVLTAVIGGGVAGYIGGLIGVLGVFAGLAIVGYADLLVHLAAKADPAHRSWSASIR